MRQTKGKWRVVDIGGPSPRVIVHTQIYNKILRRLQIAAVGTFSGEMAIIF